MVKCFLDNPCDPGYNGISNTHFCDDRPCGSRGAEKEKEL